MTTERMKSAICWQEMSACYAEEARFSMNLPMTVSRKIIITAAQRDAARYARLARMDAGLED